MQLIGAPAGLLAIERLTVSGRSTTVFESVRPCESVAVSVTR